MTGTRRREQSRRHSAELSRAAIAIGPADSQTQLNDQPVADQWNADTHLPQPDRQLRGARDRALHSLAALDDVFNEVNACANNNGGLETMTEGATFSQAVVPLP